MINKEYNDETAEELFAIGYRQISRKHKMISRVDVTIVEMLKIVNKDILKTYLKNTDDVNNDRMSSLRDYYRRVYSKDIINKVPDTILKELNRLQRYE